MSLGLNNSGPMFLIWGVQDWLDLGIQKMSAGLVFPAYAGNSIWPVFSWVWWNWDFQEQMCLKEGVDLPSEDVGRGVAGKELCISAVINEA